MGSLHISNPSIALLENGKVMLAYRFNPSHGEQNGFALSGSILGPFTSSANLTKAPGNDEDPYLWQSKHDESLHILYHNGAHGLHAYSKDGRVWSKSPTHSRAFSLELDLSGGNTFALARRERPELLFDAQGAPTHLYNGANTHGATLPGPTTATDTVGNGRSKGFSHAFSLVQALRVPAE